MNNPLIPQEPSDRSRKSSLSGGVGPLEMHLGPLKNSLFGTPQKTLLRTEFGKSVEEAQGVGKSGDLAKELVQQKYDEYARAAKRYKMLYYAVRLIAGLCAALLPFVVSNHQGIATGLSIAVVVATVFDMVFNPKDRWQLYSRATDLITVEYLKAEGDYAKYKQLISILVSTETAKLERLISLDDLLKRVRDSSTSSAPSSSE